MFFIFINRSIEKKTSIYNENETSFILKIADYKIDGNKITFKLEGKENLIAIYYAKTEEELLNIKKEIGYGHILEAKGSLNTPLNNTIPNTFNYKKYLKNQDIFYTLKIEEYHILNQNKNPILKVKNKITKRINRIDQTGYLKAFILGDKNLIDSDTYTNFQKIGITHLFALSGMHVGLLSAIILKILKRLKEPHKYLIVDILLILYGFIVGYPSSIKRCILFFILNSINKLFSLKISSIKCLLLTIVILIFSNYKIIYDIGFIYSITTVLGILISNEFINDTNKIKASLKLSFVAFLFSLPTSLSNFYEINLLSIFYNLLYVPFISIIVYPLALMTFILPFLSSLFHLSIHILEFTSSNLSNYQFFNLYMDFNLYETILFYFLLFLIFYKKIKPLYFLLFLIIAIDLIYPLFDKKGYIYFFDIGQGDSSLIISPQRKDIILIDTGGIVNIKKEEDWQKRKEYYVSDNVITFLKSKGIKKINLAILSHGDADHAKEIDNIYKEIKIDSIKINPGEINFLEQKALNLIKNTNYIPKNLELHFLNDTDYKDENANSLLTFIKIYDTKIISFGDANKESENNIIKKYNLQNIDIAKLSHHGSKTSSSKTYLYTINPNLAIISSGRNNRFNHPSQETIDTLEQLKINYLNTQSSGTIECIITPDKVTYNEYKP